jgi:hypothetical protein
MFMIIFTFLSGVLTSLLPEALKLWNKKSDHKHEIAMFGLQVQYAEQMHKFRVEEMNVSADIKAEELALEASKPIMVSYTGKSWLDGIIGLANALNAFINGTLRPFVTYGLVLLYAAVKWGHFDALRTAGYSTSQALVTKEIWTSDDMILLSAVIGHWFGSRMVKWTYQTFGKTNK